MESSSMLFNCIFFQRNKHSEKDCFPRAKIHFENSTSPKALNLSYLWKNEKTTERRNNSGEWTIKEETTKKIEGIMNKMEDYGYWTSMNFNPIYILVTIILNINILMLLENS